MKMFIPDCFTWVPHILGELVVGPVVRHHNIPDDIIIDILTRLPADCVLKCRRVCKKWRTLTSTPSFAELHLKRGAASAPPSIFVQQLDERFCVQDELDYHICDADELNNNYSKRKINTKVNTRWFHDKIANIMPFVSCSVDGLLAFQSSMPKDGQVNVLNPLTKELLRVDFPVHIEHPTGIYLDPITHEYKLLLIYYSKSLFHHFTISLKTMVTKTLNYTSRWGCTIHYARMIPSEGSLHWFVASNNGTLDFVCDDKIMVFDTKTEEFRVLSPPGYDSNSSMELLETRGKLWFFLISREKFHVWVLEDHVNWTWDKRYTVLLDWSTWRFPFRRRRDPLSLYEVSIFGINNGVELLIGWFERGMFWYNLEHKTISKASIFEKDKFGATSLIPICSCSYTKTLVRLAPFTTVRLSRESRPRCLKFEFFQG